MVENNKIYITANELAEMLGVSVGHAYKLKFPDAILKNAGMVSVHRRWSNESGKRQENRKMVDSVSLYGLAGETPEIH